MAQAQFLPYNPYLNGLRGVALVMVVLLHVLRDAAGKNFLPPFLAGYEDLFEIFAAGVDIFFMISGLPYRCQSGAP